ncbi:type 1 glutamine amidotransferase domain-containing protein [Glycomyces tarimensis]
MPKKILFIVTAADHWTLADGSRHRTGFWAEEAAVPFEAFQHAGHEITVATPGGAVPPVDPASLKAVDGEEYAEKIHSIIGHHQFQEPVAVADVRMEDFDAVYVPGGHGPMEDVASDEHCGRLVTEAYRSGKPVGVVCHGAAALLSAAGEDGANVFAGRRVTAFTNAEEKMGGLAEQAPWLLEDRLVEAGLNVEVGEPYASHVEVDDNLVSGQNPASSAPAAEEMLKQL